MLRSTRIPVRQVLSYGQNVYCRRISTKHFDPLVQAFTSKMATRQPIFALTPSQIRILTQPSKFYASLLEMVERAERRIFISSLYIGSEETELLNAISKSLEDKPALHVYFQLDLNRSTRPGPSSTAKLLLPLLRNHPDRVHVSMFRSPSLRGIMAKVVPPRFNEGWGTWHAKVYGIDDELIISGANLNKSYFTNRQDRYLHFVEQPEIAQYCFEFLRAVASFSFRLLPISARNAVTPYSCIRDDFLLQWPDPTTHPHNINDKAKGILSAFQSSRLLSSRMRLELAGESQDSSQQVMLFPIIQAGQFGIREEESTLQMLFNEVNSATKHHPRKRPRFDLTSGYFSLYKPYQKLILRCRNVDCRIVAASPKANGFFGSGGISGRIPEGYTYFEKRFMRAVRRAGRLWREAASGLFKGVQLYEWDRPGWTYHAKGIWLSPSSTSLPILTLFGSTNLNSRSAHLDTELSFVMVIPSRHYSEAEAQSPAVNTSAAIANNITMETQAVSKESITSEQSAKQLSSDHDTPLSLRQRLQYEVQNIRANASAWKGDRRKVRFTTKLIVWLVKGML